MHALDKSSQNFHKEISTHLLTVLTISVILQLEQRKLEEIAGKLKLVTEDNDLVVQGRRMGICFG